VVGEITLLFNQENPPQSPLFYNWDGYWENGGEGNLEMKKPTPLNRAEE